MPTVSIRNQRLSDAKRFYEILNNPKFVYFSAHPKSVADEKKWLAQNARKRKKNIEHNYAILYGETLVGGIGIKIKRGRPHIGEIGYFVDELYWGKGIATKAVKLAERIGFTKLGLRRIEITMQPGNKASEKVAIKCGYAKEGLLRKAVKNRAGVFKDVHLYAKVR